MKRNIQVLLVEDDPDDVDLLETAFKESSVHVIFITASAGDKALAYLDNSNPLPDILVLDLNIPKKNGKEILKIVKANPKYDSMPIIVLTTSFVQADRDFCLKAGARYYFTKPTRLVELGKIVNTIIETAN